MKLFYFFFPFVYFIFFSSFTRIYTYTHIILLPPPSFLPPLRFFVQLVGPHTHSKYYVCIISHLFHVAFIFSDLHILSIRREILKENIKLMQVCYAKFTELSISILLVCVFVCSKPI